MKVCIFEDSFTSDLSPLNDLRHTSELICGASTLKEKIESHLNGKYDISIHCRNYLSAICGEKFTNSRINHFQKEDYLFVNSRVLFSKEFFDGLLLTLGELENSCILIGETIAAFIISSDKIEYFKQKIQARREDNLISHKDISALKLKKVKASDLNPDEAEELRVISHPGDLLLFHEEEMAKDLEFLFKKKRDAKRTNYRSEFINRSRVFIAPGCKISPQSVFDASKGSIYISNNVVTEPFSYICGPVYVGEDSTIRSGSKLYGPLSIGRHSKVSGEITNSIIHDFVNKQHLGFLGHSYLCEWVNLGAGTTTSNLKNNYSSIHITIGDNTFDTGSIFLGSIIGDHTKTGINTMLNTGTVIGISSNLFGGGFHSKSISPFSWADAGGKRTQYDIEKAVATARISMKRRNVQMSKTYEDLMRYLFKNRKK